MVVVEESGKMDYWSKAHEEIMSVQPNIRFLDWFGKFGEEEPELEDLSDPELLRQGLQDYDELLDNFNSVVKE